MPKERRIYAPAGYGGIIRYPEEEKSKIKIKPQHVIWIVLGVVLLELILHLFF